MSGRRAPYAYLAAAMTIAGSAVVAAKLMVSAVPVFLAAELGIGIGLIFMLPLALRESARPRLDGKTHRLLLLQALFGVVFYRVFIFWGMQYTTAAAGGLISSAAPACIAVMAFVILHEAIPLHRVIGVVCVTAGLIVVNVVPFFNDYAHAADAFKGNVLVLIAVLCEAGFSIMSKATCTPMSALFRTTMVSLYAFFCMLPFALYDMLNYDITSIDTMSLACIVYYGIFVSFLSYVFWFKGIVAVPASTGGAFTGFVPLSGMLLSWLFLREPLSFGHWLGLLFVLAGIAVSCLQKSTIRAKDD